MVAAPSVHMLADRPHLIPRVAHLRWREWGDEPDRQDESWWVDITRRESGRDALPVTFVAVGPAGEVVGAVGLGEYDIEERRDTSPWILGMIVDPNHRGRGVGRHLLDRLVAFAVGRGHTEVWVATGDPAVAFYERCGWRVTERLRRDSGDPLTVLCRRVAGGGTIGVARLHA